MESNVPRVSKLVLRVVGNQLDENKPVEAKQAYNRLIAAGYSDEDARHLIGSVIADEMRRVVETSKPFNAERYEESLRKLPEQAAEQS